MLHLVCRYKPRAIRLQPMLINWLRESSKRREIRRGFRIYHQNTATRRRIQSIWTMQNKNHPVGILWIGLLNVNSKMRQWPSTLLANFQFCCCYSRLWYMITMPIIMSVFLIRRMPWSSQNAFRNSQLPKHYCLLRAPVGDKGLSSETSARGYVVQWHTELSLRYCL